MKDYDNKTFLYHTLIDSLVKDGWSIESVSEDEQITYLGKLIDNTSVGIQVWAMQCSVDAWVDRRPPYTKYQRRGMEVEDGTV